MKLIFHLTALIAICVFCQPLQSKAQALPVGTPVLEDALRRAQLLGEIDSSISFTSRPLFPTISMKLANTFDPYVTMDKERWTKFDGALRFANNKGVIRLLPFTWQQQFN